MWLLGCCLQLQFIADCRDRGACWIDCSDAPCAYNVSILRP